MGIPSLKYIRSMTFTRGEITMLTTMVVVIVGYMLNIFGLFQVSDILTGQAIVQILGIMIPPIGVVMGYFQYLL